MLGVAAYLHATSGRTPPEVPVELPRAGPTNAEGASESILVEPLNQVAQKNAVVALQEMYPDIGGFLSHVFIGVLLVCGAGVL